MAILGEGMCFLFLAAIHRCREGPSVALNKRKALWFDIQAERGKVPQGPGTPFCTDRMLSVKESNRKQRLN